jgi:hypothetical protein
MRSPASGFSDRTSVSRVTSSEVIPLWNSRVSQTACICMGCTLRKIRSFVKPYLQVRFARPLGSPREARGPLPLAWAADTCRHTYSRSRIFHAAPFRSSDRSLATGTAALFVLSGGINGGVAESTRRCGPSPGGETAVVLKKLRRSLGARTFAPRRFPCGAGRLPPPPSNCLAFCWSGPSLTAVSLAGSQRWPVAGISTSFPPSSRRRTSLSRASIVERKRLHCGAAWVLLRRGIICRNRGNWFGEN